MRIRIPRTTAALLICWSCALIALARPDGAAGMKGGLFARENLVAWCIVPFDAKQRGPAERAEMLARIGVTRVAYDWRDHHVKEWDEELRQYKKNGVELVGFWAPARHKEILELFRRHGVRAQLWVDGSVVPAPAAGDTQAQRVEGSARALAAIARQANEYGCLVGLYNHGGWFGEPENQVAIIERLRADGIKNVGIVYNLHHGHEHMSRLPQVLALMKPHLLCVNLNGMKQAGPKILPLGQGENDAAPLQAIIASGYEGPVGILNHRQEVDAEQGLKENLAGLEKLLKQLERR